MTPQKAQAYRTRSKELLDILRAGGKFEPKPLN